ncbi:lipopolysaccharide heptosyltransferase II [Undibacterium sp. Jales W-56]|uniref:lipopolysaccharide heptosyltransferase II n=1 Tax=Undibacterium sp. Jales W-56 TaxID=2897325 RepID=UPI0021D20F80|nr:lipopolysaccharide heptosyltransferase II [Undibacterium sp. Jales W-56]MCU6435779.1 lipopolysaccharide heptosyltransferase II [Undibacterium sp. Jales W-56]
MSVPSAPFPACANAPRILVIAPNWIGDAVMAQPLLRLLKQQHPEHAIDVLAAAWVAPVLRAMAEVDTVLETPFKHGALQLRERWRYARQLRQRGYVAAYVLPNTLKFALIPWLAGIPKRVGYKGESRYVLINLMHHDDPAAPRAMVPFYAALATEPATQITMPIARPSLFVNETQIAATFTQLGLSLLKPLICFAPGAEFGNAKRWPASHFAQLADQVAVANPETQIVLLGSPKDSAVCDEIKALSPSVHHFAGKTSLDQAIALIARAAAMVSNDSGLLHIASALNRPVIALYGPTDPEHAPPFSDVAHSLSLHLSCAPCKQRECPLGHHDCMQKLSAEMVWAPLQAILQHPVRG